MKRGARESEQSSSSSNNSHAGMHTRKRIRSQASQNQRGGGLRSGAGGVGAGSRPHSRGMSRGPTRPIAGIASESTIRISEEVRAKAPTLSELRHQRLEQSGNKWPWDRAPKGCESLSARAFKVLGGTSAPEGSYQKLPDEIKRLRRPVPLVPTNSWVFRIAGGKVHTSLLNAAQAVANGAPRPANLPSFESSLFTDKHTIIARNVEGDVPAKLIERYGTIETHTELEPHTILVKPKTVPTVLRTGDMFLIRQEPEANSVIEVLNAVSMAKPDEDVEPTLKSLCTSLGESVKRLWRSSDSLLPYELPRIFIEIENTEHTTQLAEALAKKKVHGRPLITTINRSSELAR